MKKFIAPGGFMITLLIFACIFLLAGCANRESVTECLKGHTFGFWGGLWHGIIAPIDLVVSLWKADVTVFAQNNNGAWYAFGFIIGSGGWGFFGGKGVKRVRHTQVHVNNDKFDHAEIVE